MDTTNNPIDHFINLSEANAELMPDEIFWCDTGAWTMQDNQFQYIGYGLDTMLDTLRNIQQGRFAFCLSARDSAIFISSNIFRGQMHGELSIDIYCTNSFLPFVEVLEPFREAIQKMGGYYIDLTQKLDYSSIEISKFSFKNTQYKVIPYAIVPIGGDPFVIKNDFGPFEIDSVNKLPCLFSEISGGTLKSDFFRPVDFYYEGSIQLYNDIIILYGHFHCGHDIFRFNPPQNEVQTDLPAGFIKTR